MVKVSEYLTKEEKKNAIKEILRQLHEGKSVDEVKVLFKKTFDTVSSSELAEAEQALLYEGFEVSDIQNLCDVHAAAVGDFIENLEADMEEVEGHPLHVLHLENEAISEVCQSMLDAIKSAPSPKSHPILSDGLDKLRQLESHYQRKENLFFPFLEKHGLDAPPKVMWGVHDEIRSMLKSVYVAYEHRDIFKLKKELPEVLNKINDMVYKEENIFMPMLKNNLTQFEWNMIAADSDEYGFCMIDEPAMYLKPQIIPSVASTEHLDEIMFKTGKLNQSELKGLLEVLPMDITFVDKDDQVRYFSHGETRAFKRSPSIIGRKVENCHPPKSLHVVTKLMEELSNGVKDKEDFWIQRGEELIHIRYAAVRDENGQYLGVLEMTQDIAPYKKLEGEKRLMK